MVAALSLAGYLVGRCGTVDFYYMRDDLLALFGAAGLTAWFFAARPRPLMAAAWIALMCLWLAFPASLYARLWHEYLRSPPPGGKQIMIQHLDAEGHRYVIRVAEYNGIVNEHRGEAIRIGRRRCEGGREVSPGVWFCPP
jgi:hypothetical protein